MVKLSTISAGYLQNLRADQSFVDLMKEISDEGVPEVPIFNPSKAKTDNDWAYNSGRRLGAIGIISVLTGKDGV